MQQTVEWQRVKTIFAAALERSPASRAQFLDEACRENQNLRREVESLLDSHEDCADFIEHSPLEAGVDAAPDADVKSIERAGAYRIIREIGRGGMGVVFLAEREDEYKKRVAVKIVRRGLGTETVLRRFRRERQILAGLEHPYIARLLDGGTTDDGLPYLVMEYVEGLPLLDYCERKNLPIADRLQIFRRICAAVEYAHQNLVVHRDLKPSNILVGDDGTPKLLDFGISKLLQADASEPAATETNAALRVFTPEYASPEQLAGGRVTTASDVYSLGIVLYELLTGTRPYRFATHDFYEIARVVNAATAPKPSIAVQKLPEIAPATEENQATTAADRKRLANRLRGDLDNIVLKAMHKDPPRRYESAAALNEDLRRHLGGLTVRARQDGIIYRADKFVRRHRFGVAALALILLLLVAGLSATLWQARRAEEQAAIARRQAAIAEAERDRAAFAQERAERTNDFLQKMLGSAAPDEQGRDAKVIDVLRLAEEQARKELSDRPEVLASVLRTVGNTYKSLVQYESAEESLRLAVMLSEQLYKTDEASVAVYKFELADVLQVQGKSLEAEVLLREAVEIHRRIAPDGSLELAAALGRLGGALRGRDNPAAAAFLHEALDLSRRLSGAESLDTLAILHDLALLRSEVLDTAGEIEIYEQIVPILRGSPANRGRLSIALMNNAVALMNENRLDEADALINESLALQRKVFGTETVNRASGEVFLARLRLRQNRPAEAQTLAEQALSLQKKLLPAGSSDFVGSSSAFGEALTAQGKARQGEPFLRQALELIRKDELSEEWVIGLHESRLGECLARQKRFAAAEPLLLDGNRKIGGKLNAKHPHAVQSRNRLSEFYVQTNQPEKAALYLD